MMLLLVLVSAGNLFLGFILAIHFGLGPSLPELLGTKRPAKADKQAPQRTTA